MQVGPNVRLHWHEVFFETIWGKGGILKEDMDTFFEPEEGAGCIPPVPS